MNAKIYVFVICVKAIIYLLLCNLHDCTFKVVTTVLKLMKAGLQVLNSGDDFVKILGHITSETTRLVALAVKHNETAITHTTVTKTYIICLIQSLTLKQNI